MIAATASSLPIAACHCVLGGRGSMTGLTVAAPERDRRDLISA